MTPTSVPLDSKPGNIKYLRESVVRHKRNSVRNSELGSKLDLTWLKSMKLSTVSANSAVVYRDQSVQEGKVNGHLPKDLWISSTNKG